LLEARKDDDIVQRMLKSLYINEIKRNITDIYFMFLDQYHNEYVDRCFNHVFFFEK